MIDVLWIPGELGEKQAGMYIHIFCDSKFEKKGFPPLFVPELFYCSNEVG